MKAKWLAHVRLAVFVVVCLLGTFALLMVFAQLRFQQEKTYKAEFTNVSGLKNGNFVRIAGVEVGKVKKISIKRDATAVVEFSADDSVMLTEGTRAVIRYDNLIGGRYLELQEGAGGVNRLDPGATIPLDRTEPALGPRRTDRRIPPAVPRAGPRPGQRAERAADSGLPGSRSHDQLVPGTDRRVHQHTGRPRRADRSGHHQPQHRPGIAGRPEHAVRQSRRLAVGTGRGPSGHARPTSATQWPTPMSPRHPSPISSQQVRARLSEHCGAIGPRQRHRRGRPRLRRQSARNPAETPTSARAPRHVRRLLQLLPV